MDYLDSINWNETSPSPSLDVGKTSTNRMVLIGFFIEDPVVEGFVTPAADVSIGGVAVSEFATPVPTGTTNNYSGNNSHLDLYVAFDADLGSLEDGQTIAISSGVANVKFGAIAVKNVPQTLQTVNYDYQATGLRSSTTFNSAIEAGGGILQFVWNTANGAGVTTFDGSMTEAFNLNPGSPTGWIGLAYQSAPTAIAAKDWVTSIGSSESNVMTASIVFPAAVAATSNIYSSDTPAGASQKTIPGPLGAGSAAGVSVGSRVWIPDTADGNRTIGDDGVIASSNPGNDTVEYLVLDTVNNVWVEYTETVTGSGTSGAISFPGDLNHGSLGATFTSDVDLAGFQNLQLEFSDGTNTILIPVRNPTANGGTFDFDLFELVDEEDGLASGIEADASAAVRLLQNGTELAAGTYTGRGPVNGWVRRPTEVEAGALANLVVGEQYLVENLQGGSITVNGVYTRAVSNSFILRYYTHEDGVWTRHETFYASNNYIEADISHNLDLPAGPLDWTTLGGINTGGAWSTDGDCAKPDNLNEGGIVQFPDERLTQDRIRLSVMYGAADDNDTIAAGIYTDDTYQNGNYGEITSSGTSEPDRYEFKRLVAGVVENLDFALLPVLVADSRVDIELFKPSGTFTLFHVAPDGTETEIKQFVDATHSGLEFPGIVYDARNTNTSCLKAFGFNGVSPLQLALVNGSAGVAEVDGSDDFTFTENHLPEWIRYTDLKGQSVTDNDPSLDAARVAGTDVDISGLWKGPITITTDSGLTRDAVLVAPVGWQSVNLNGTNPLIAQVAGWNASGQNTLPIEVGGQAVTALPSGDVRIAGGALPVALPIRHNPGDGSGYGALVNEWLFTDISQGTGSPSPDSALEQTNLVVDLGPFVPSVDGIPLDPDPEGLGESGNGVRFEKVSGPGSLVGDILTINEAEGVYPVEIRAYDPAGNSRLLSFDAVFTSAPVTATGTRQIIELEGILR